MGEAGEMVNNTFATRAANIDPDKERVKKYTQHKWAQKPMRIARYLLWVWVAGAIALYATGHYIWGTLVVLIALLWRYLVSVAADGLTESVFTDGLLMPAVITKKDFESKTGKNSCDILVLANMGTGMNTRAVWGLQRLKINQLPIHQIQEGERVPCVAYFNTVVKNNTRMHFVPSPLCWATADTQVLSDAIKYIAQDTEDIAKSGYKNEWEILSALQHKYHGIPYDKVLFLSEDLQEIDPLTYVNADLIIDKDFEEEDYDNYDNEDYDNEEKEIAEVEYELDDEQYKVIDYESFKPMQPHLINSIAQMATIIKDKYEELKLDDTLASFAVYKNYIKSLIKEEINETDKIVHIQYGSAYGLHVLYQNVENKADTLLFTDSYKNQQVIKLKTPEGEIFCPAIEIINHFE